MMFLKRLTTAAVLALAASAVQANSVYLDPPSQNASPADGTATFDLWMDFTAPTVGGGVNLLLGGPLSFNAFTPSAYFTTTPDAAFSGHGADKADAGKDYGIYLGSFSTMSGRNNLGTITVNLTGTGNGTVDLDLNDTWGGGAFFTDSFDSIAVNLTGGSVAISAVPLPPALWLFGTALFGITAMARRKFTS